MIDQSKVQSDLSMICPGWRLLQTQVLEIQYRDFIEKNVMLLASKLNFPQNLTIKVNIETGRISEIYPSTTEFDKNANSIPYYSIPVLYEKDRPVLNKEPVDYYFVEKETAFDHIFKEKDIIDFYIIQRLDIKSNVLNKWYVNLKLKDIKKVCNQETTDFIIQKNPDNIFIYSNDHFNDCNTLLLSYLPKFIRGS
jgi:hypothetical protein